MSAEDSYVYLLFDYAWATEGLPTLIGVFSDVDPARQAARGLPHAQVRRVRLDTFKPLTLDGDDAQLGEYVEREDNER